MTRRSLRRAAWQLHRWLGIAAFSVLALVGATGALLAFEDEIVQALNRDVRTVEPRASGRLPLPELLAKVQEQAPAERLSAVELAGDPRAAVRVTLESPADDGDRPRRASRYADPYTGRLDARAGERGEEFFREVRTLHRWLVVGPIGSRDVGREIVALCAIALVLLGLSGLWVRWPRTRTQWRTWLKLDLRARGRTRLSNPHVVLGAWAFPIYLVIALTGLSWSYPSYRDALESLAGVNRPEPTRESRRAAAERPRAPATRPLSAAAWSALLATADTADIGHVSLRLPTSEGEPIRMRYLGADPAHSRAFDVVSIDPATLRILERTPYAAQPLAARLVTSRFALHSGSYFGLPGRLLFTLASLALPVVAVTGALLWLRTLGSRKRARDTTRASARRRSDALV